MSENPNISPGVDVLLDRQKEGLIGFAAIAKLGAIGVVLPTDSAQQFAIAGMESDEVATAPMVGTKDKLLRRELYEGALDVIRVKTRAIPPDGDDLVIAKLRNRLHGVLEARGKISACLLVAPSASRDPIPARREKVKIDVW